MPRLGPFTNRLDLIAPVQWYAGMRWAPHPRLAECDQGSWVNISHTTIKHGYSGEAPDKSSALPSVDYFSKSISGNWQLQTCILPSSNMEVEDPSLPSKFFRNIYFLNEIPMQANQWIQRQEGDENKSFPLPFNRMAHPGQDPQLLIPYNCWFGLVDEQMEERITSWSKE